MSLLIWYAEFHNVYWIVVRILKLNNGGRGCSISGSQQYIFIPSPVPKIQKESTQSEHNQYRKSGKTKNEEQVVMHRLSLFMSVFLNHFYLKKGIC